MRAKLSKIISALWLLLSGAWLSLYYIELHLDQSIALIEETRNHLGVAWWAALFAFSLVEKREPGPQPDISPALSGTSVILLTGGVAALAVGWRGEGQDVLLAGFILLATIMIGIIAWRFARKNAAMIGEAQFRPVSRD